MKTRLSSATGMNPMQEICKLISKRLSTEADSAEIRDFSALEWEDGIVLTNKLL
jgi:hypothetical protein